MSKVYMGILKIKKPSNKKLITFCFLALVVVLIIYFTGKTSEESNVTSRSIAAWIKNLIDRYFKIDSSDYFWSNTLNNIIRKVAHFSEYLLLAIAACWFFRQYIKKYTYLAITTTAFCALIAMTDEFRQNFVSGRSPRWFDVKVDVIGSLVGIGLFILFHFMYTRYKNMKIRIHQLEQQVHVLQGDNS